MDPAVTAPLKIVATLRLSPYHVPASINKGDTGTPFNPTMLKFRAT